MRKALLYLGCVWERVCLYCKTDHRLHLITHWQKQIYRWATFAYQKFFVVVFLALFVLCAQYCQFLWIIYSWLLLRVYLTFVIKYIFHWRMFTVKPTIGMPLLRVLVHHFTMRGGLVVIESRESELSYICGFASFFDFHIWFLNYSNCAGFFLGIFLFLT